MAGRSQASREKETIERLANKYGFKATERAISAQVDVLAMCDPHFRVFV